LLKIPSGRIFNKIHYDFNFPQDAKLFSMHEYCFS